MISVNGGEKKQGGSLSETETKNLFRRDGSVKSVEVWLNF